LSEVKEVRFGSMWRIADKQIRMHRIACNFPFGGCGVPLKKHVLHSRRSFCRFGIEDTSSQNKATDLPVAGSAERGTTNSLADNLAETEQAFFLGHRFLITSLCWSKLCFFPWWKTILILYAAGYANFTVTLVLHIRFRKDRVYF